MFKLVSRFGYFSLGMHCVVSCDNLNFGSALAHCDDEKSLSENALMHNHSVIPVLWLKT